MSVSLYIRDIQTYRHTDIHTSKQEPVEEGISADSSDHPIPAIHTHPAAPLPPPSPSPHWRQSPFEPGAPGGPGGGPEGGAEDVPESGSRASMRRMDSGWLQYPSEEQDPEGVVVVSGHGDGQVGGDAVGCDGDCSSNDSMCHVLSHLLLCVSS